MYCSALQNIAETPRLTLRYLGYLGSGYLTLLPTFAHSIQGPSSAWHLLVIAD